MVSNIADFASNIKREAYFSYGQNLAFVHTLDAFDEQSQKLAAFIMRAVARRREIAAAHASTALGRAEFGGGSSRRRGSSLLPGRSLNLEESEAVDLMDLFGADPVEFECTDASLPAHMSIHIVEDDPDIPLRIIGQNGKGYLIARDEDVVFAAEGRRMYVLQDDMLFRCTPAFARCADFLRNVYRSDDDSLFISAGDAPLFCATMLPQLESAFCVSAPDELEHMRPVPAQIEFYLDRDKTRILLCAQAVYGTRRFTLVGTPPAHLAEALADVEPESSSDAPSYESPAAHAEAGADENATSEPAVLRDEEAEQRARAMAFAYVSSKGTLSLKDSDAVGTLLFGGLAKLRETGSVFTTPTFDRLVSSRKPRPQIGLSLAGNIIDLAVSSEDLEPDELAAVLSSYRQKRRFHRLRDGAFLNLEDHDLSELNRIADDFDLSPRALASGHVELPTYFAYFLDREFGDAQRSETFASYVSRLRTLDQSAYEPPSDLNGTLRPYQLEGFRWLSALVDLDFGGILADEMGLGKSIQLISLLLARRNEARETGPSLITCPASLVYNWLAEFERFAPDLVVKAVEGTPAERARIRALKGVDVLVASYDLVRIDAKGFAGRTWWCHVLDEAQYIKNHATLTTRAVKRIPSEHRFALTGTPIENRLSEVWSIFDFLMPGFFGSYARFRERFEHSIVGGDDAAAARLRALVEPFVLRRLKTNVLPDLPDKMESVVYVPLAGEQRRLYSAGAQKLREDLTAQKKVTHGRDQEAKRGYSKIEVLAELTRLRQVALDPALVYEGYHAEPAKTRAILDLIEQSCEAGHKVLVFSQFKRYLLRLADRLDEMGVPHYLITGSTAKRERFDMATSFNRDDTPVFLVSLKAGGTGLNLIGASTVIHADPWWNAAAVDQATDRAHRIGQTDRVNVYKVVAKDTVEERILDLQEAKTKLADSIIGQTSGASLANLTADDLISLLDG